MATVILLEDDMEKELIQRGIDIYEDQVDKLVDSVMVSEEAINLGFDPYMLEGVGEFNSQLIFIKRTKDPIND